MKRAFSILLLCLLLYGCFNLNNQSTACEIPPRFSSEKEFVEGVKYARKSKIVLPVNFLDRDIEPTFKIDRITEFFMTVNVPSGYEIYKVNATHKSVWSVYKKKGEEYNCAESYTYGCRYKEAGWSIKGTIKGYELVSSKYSDKLYFDYDEKIDNYPRVFFEG